MRPQSPTNSPGMRGMRRIRTQAGRTLAAATSHPDVQVSNTKLYQELVLSPEYLCPSDRPLFFLGRLFKRCYKRQPVSQDTKPYLSPPTKPFPGTSVLFLSALVFEETKNGHPRNDHCPAGWASLGKPPSPLPLWFAGQTQEALRWRLPRNFSNAIACSPSSALQSAEFAGNPSLPAHSHSFIRSDPANPFRKGKRW